jgi:hypothetical protein
VIIRAVPGGNTEYAYVLYLWPAVKRTLEAMKGDIESGLVGDIQRRTAGEVVSDMVGLAKEALGDGSKGAKNVAAVLAAAAYEDTLRRMGATLPKVQGRPQLADVVSALKNEKVIQGAEVGIVQSHLKVSERRAARRLGQGW